MEQRLRGEAAAARPVAAGSGNRGPQAASSTPPAELVSVADAVAACGDDAAAVALLLDAFEREPGLFALVGEETAPAARRVGGAAWLRYRLCALRGLMRADPPDGDLVREQYSELLEDYCGDPDALAPIRAVGKEIEALVAAGAIGRALVRRGTWRSRGEG